MKQFVITIILSLLLLVSCGGGDIPLTEIPVAQLPTTTSTIMPPAIEPTTPLPTVPPEQTNIPTNTPHPPADTAAPRATAAPLPTVRPTATAVSLDPSLPMPTGRIYFLWDPNPIPEVRGIGEIPETNLYEAIPGDTPNDWQVGPVIEMVGQPIMIPAPDSNKLAIRHYDDTNEDGVVDTRGGTDTTNIYSYRISDGVISQLTEQHANPSAFSWSPLSTELAYSQQYRDVFLAHLDSSMPKNEFVVAFPDRITRFSWSPRGELLAVNRFPGNIDIFNMETGVITSIVTSTDYLSNMQWSENGKWLSVFPEHNHGLLLVNIETLENIELIDSASLGFSAWSPHQQWLAFTDGAKLSIWNANSLETQLLVSMDALSLPSWSPDGNSITVGFVEEDRSGLLFIDPVNGSQKELDLGMPIDQPIWSPDGEWLLFSSGVDDQVGLYMIHKDDSTPFLFLEITGRQSPYDVHWLPSQ